MINQATSIQEGNQIPQVNQEITTNKLRGHHITKTLYRHPNHKSRHLNQFGNPYHLDQRQVTYVPKNIEVTIIQSYDNNSFQVSSDHKTPQIINLGWLDHFIVRQFCTTLKSSYRFVLSQIIVSQDEKTETLRHEKRY